MQNHVISEKKESRLECCFVKKLSRCWWRSCQDFDKKARERGTTYLATEIRYCLQKLIFFEVFKVFLPLDRSPVRASYVQATIAQSTAVLKCCREVPQGRLFVLLETFPERFLGSSAKACHFPAFSCITAYNIFVCMVSPVVLQWKHHNWNL